MEPCVRNVKVAILILQNLFETATTYKALMIYIHFQVLNFGSQNQKQIGLKWNSTNSHCIKRKKNNSCKCCQMSITDDNIAKDTISYKNLGKRH